MLGILFMVLCLLMAVIAFFMILFTNKHPKSKLMVIFDCLSISCAIASLVFFTLAGKAAPSAGAFNFGDIPMLNASGGIMWGIFVAIALLDESLFTFLWFHLTLQAIEPPSRYFSVYSFYTVASSPEPVFSMI